MSSSPVLSLLLLLLLVTTTITTAEAAKAKTVRAPPPPSSATSRQAAPTSTTGINNNNVNTSLALANPSHSGPTASEILLPAMRTLVGGPLRLLRQLAAELVAFLRAHRPLPLQLYDHRFWGSVATALPARASAYWSALVSMESTCARRTVCDLAELASRRLPKWAQQAVLFYLNAFAETNEYYGVAIAGLTLKNCRASFEDCDVDRFFARLQGNVTEAIKATVGPVGAAFADLVEVASTTMRSIVTGEEREDLRRPQPQPQDSLRAPAPASRTFEEEAEEEEDEEPVMMGGSGRRPPLPMMASSSSSGGVMNRLPVAQPSHHFPRH